MPRKRAKSVRFQDRVFVEAIFACGVLTRQPIAYSRRRTAFLRTREASSELVMLPDTNSWIQR